VSVDLVTMSDAQVLVLNRMDDYLGYPFRDIAADTGVPEKETRTIIRQFHVLGLADYGPLFSEDEPRVMGKGYWLSKAGWALQREVRRMLSPWICAREEAMWTPTPTNGGRCG
jgi:hypothetical protein